MKTNKHLHSFRDLLAKGDEYGISKIIDDADLETQKILIRRYIDKKREEKAFSRIARMIRWYDLPAMGIDEDEVRLYGEAMENKQYSDAMMIHWELGLPRKLLNRAALHLVREELNKADRGEGTWWGEQSLYEIMRQGPGLANPIGQRAAQAFFSYVLQYRNATTERGIMPFRDKAVEIAREANLGDCCMALAESRSKNFFDKARRFFLGQPPLFNYSPELFRVNSPL